jgi:ribosomal-protein-alanine N-acetyltransferase
MTELATDRLILRRWRAEDRAPFAAMNADPVVMEHFPAPLTAAQSDALVDQIERWFDSHRYGLWALERRADGAFLGFTGLSDVGFDELGLDEIVSFTARRNDRSIAVMERIGMRRDPADDFDHPRVAAGNPLRPHVLYRVRA